MDLPDLTLMLNKWSRGDTSIEEKLINRIYPHIYSVAEAQLRKYKEDLDVPEVISEAFLQLKNKNEINWQNRNQFLAISSQIIRRFLIDYFRKRNSQKRGQNQLQLTLDKMSSLISGEPDVNFDLLQFDDLLKRLGAIDSLAAKVVELKFFVGLTSNEISDICEISVPSVNYNWKFARSWLLNQLT